MHGQGWGAGLGSSPAQGLPGGPWQTLLPEVSGNWTPGWAQQPLPLQGHLGPSAWLTTTTELAAHVGPRGQGLIPPCRTWSACLGPVGSLPQMSGNGEGQPKRQLAI